MDDHTRELLEKLLEQLSTVERTKIERDLGIASHPPSVVEVGLDDFQAYTIKEAATFLRFTPRHLVRLCQTKKIKALQVGRYGEYRIWGEDIKDFMKRHFR